MCFYAYAFVQISLLRIAYFLPHVHREVASVLYQEIETDQIVTRKDIEIEAEIEKGIGVEIGEEVGVVVGIDTRKTNIKLAGA